MKSKIWIVGILFVVGVVGAIALARSNDGGSSGEWNASGFIEAEIISIAPEIAGRVTARPVSEGDEVQQGDVLLKLEDDILSAQVDLAQGKLHEAQAVLAQAKAGARAQSIAKAEAQLKLAQTALKPRSKHGAMRKPSAIIRKRSTCSLRRRKRKSKRRSNNSTRRCCSVTLPRRRGRITAQRRIN